MGYIRKALSITTLGLSNLVLEDDSKPPVRSRQKARPARKRANTKAKAQPTASARRSARKRKVATAKPRPVSAKPKKSSAGKRATSRPTATRTTARAKSPRATRAQPAASQQPRAQAPAQTAAASTATRPSAPSGGVAIALDRIAKLHEHGALTDREFVAAKSRILGTTPPSEAQETGSGAFPSIEANVAAARRLAAQAEPERHPSVPVSDASRGI